MWKNNTEATHLSDVELLFLNNNIYDFSAQTHSKL